VIPERDVSADVEPDGITRQPRLRKDDECGTFRGSFGSAWLAFGSFSMSIISNTRAALALAVAAKLTRKPRLETGAFNSRT